MVAGAGAGAIIGSSEPVIKSAPKPDNRLTSGSAKFDVGWEGVDGLFTIAGNVLVVVSGA
jgi:hypothetical protein